MSYLDTLANKKIAILGLGVSGLSCVSFLSKFRIKPFVMDSNLESKGVKHVKLKWPKINVYQLDDEQLFAADMLIISPGIALSTPKLVEAKKRGIEIIGDVELFARINNKPVIAITGSNGKTTVTKLVTQLLNDAGHHAVFGGNIGVPVLDLLAKPFDVAVLELSSFQLETTDSLKAKTATILNVVEDHMDRYDSFDGYVDAKQKIYEHCETAVYNRLDAKTQPVKGATCSFGIQSPTNNNVGVRDCHFSDGDQQICPLNSLKLVGQHNVLNALAAIALVKPFKVDAAVIEQTFKQFKGLPHRCELVTGTGKVQWINDSKATNVGATVAALQGIKPLCKGKLILIAGGVGKDADFTPLQQALNEHVDHLITFGRDGEQIAKLVNQAGLFVKADRATSLDEAVNKAFKLAANDDCVLLSPACASFDMFANFEARGERFIALAQEAYHV
ncbi:MAG: UDP-N-acetylmuramoyl-L-alanine--D-glutamate ligase [Algicola sp.]|nr:UDP-N-acetylmuramoyl-L-alanine--D-glutamate ligase [Algicola sp.]